MGGKAWTRTFLRSLSSGVCLEEATWCSGVCLRLTASSPPSPDPRGTGLGLPQRRLILCLMTTHPCEAWTLNSFPQASVWVSYRIFIPILQMRTLRPRVICPCYHLISSFLTSGAGPRWAVVGHWEIISCPVEEGGHSGAGVLFLVPSQLFTGAGTVNAYLSLCLPTS